MDLQHPSLGAQAPHRQLIAGNWKMNGLRESLAEVSEAAAGLPPDAPFDAVLCPPFTLIAPAAERARGRALRIGGQDCHAAEAGAYTGEVSAEMLKDAGASAVILGHSERRSLHGETSAAVRAKAQAAHRAGLLAIICIGETAGQRRFGLAEEVCCRQLRDSLPPDATAANTAIAYEPVWSIGTGVTPEPDEIAAMHAVIRAGLPDGRAWRVLYGGSVKPETSEAILGLPEVGGVLIGGASLSAADFLAIAASARTRMPV